MSNKRDELWTELCTEYGAEYIDGTMWKYPELRIKHRVWVITLDTRVVSRSHGGSTSYTRLQAPYRATNDFSFVIFPATFFSRIAVKLGMETVKIGDARMCSKYILRGSNQMKVCELLASDRFRELILQAPTLELSSKQMGGNNRVVYLETTPEVRELAVLKTLVSVVRETLDRLCGMGSAIEEEPRF